MLRAVAGGQPTPFGRYQLETKLASGGMGEVFLARMQGPAGFEKKVVIKRILPHLAESPEFIERFLDEGRLVVQLSHGNIVQVFDMGSVEGHYYLAMEYVDGLDLRVLNKRLEAAGARMPITLAVHVASEVAKGLGHAHLHADDEGRNQGIIHRDVSPSNVMISRSGEVKLLDFGIAKAASRMVHSISGSLHGKFLYMSPEQAAGRTLDRRSDVFSLGTLLYELITGKRPFEGETELRTLDLIRAGQYVPVSDLRPDVPEALEALMDKCMARDPEGRYPGGSDAHRALLAWQVEAKAIIPASDLAGFLADYVRARTATQPLSLDAALNQELDALLGSGAAKRVGTRLTPHAMDRLGTPLELDDTLSRTPSARPPTHTAERPITSDGPPRIDTATTGRSVLDDMPDRDVPRSSKNRILLVTMILLVGVLVTLNVVMLYALKTGDDEDQGSGDGDSLGALARAPSDGTGQAGTAATEPNGPTAGTDAPDGTSQQTDPDVTGVEPGTDIEADATEEGTESTDDESVMILDVIDHSPVTIAVPDHIVEPATTLPMRLALTGVPTDAAVTVDGVELERSDDGYYDVPHGDSETIALVATKKGYSRLKKTVDRVAGETVTLDNELAPIKRMVTVKVEPARAALTVGGREVAKGSHRFAVTIESTVRGKAVLAGYVEKPFVARYGGSRNVSLKLVAKATGRLSVRIFPVDAEVRIDARRIKRSTALISTTRPPGPHKLSIRTKDGKSKVVPFSVIAGKETKLGQFTLSSD